MNTTYLDLVKEPSLVSDEQASVAAESTVSTAAPPSDGVLLDAYSNGIIPLTYVNYR